MNSHQPIVNWSVIRQGDRICRRRKSRMANAIMRTMSGEHWDIPEDAWNHDAIVCDDSGRPAIGDALMGVNCQLTSPFEWERDCELNDTRLIILRPPSASIEDGVAAATWWINNVHGHPYDKVALKHLLLKRIFGDHLARLGDPLRFYCSEGADRAWEKGPPIGFFLPGADRSSPGKTWRAWKENALVEVAGSLTPYGERFSVRQGRTLPL